MLEILHKRRKFYLKHLLGLNGLYSRYQSNMLFFLMIFTVQFAAVGYCGVQIGRDSSNFRAGKIFSVRCSMDGKSIQEKIKTL